jgi:hypothetical protein
MSVDVSTPVARSPRASRAGAGEAPAEPRSFDAKATTRSEAVNNPSMTLRLPHGKGMTVVVDRVRARPAATPNIATALGQNAFGLGAWGTFFPKSVNRFLGMNASPQLIQLVFGLREFYTAFSLLGDPTRKDALWARVVGDLFDIGVLASLDRADNPKRGNARLALSVVLAVTALDAIAAVRMTTVKRNCL